MKLSPDQLDALTEVVNIGVGRAAATLCELVDDHIALRVPNVRVCDPSLLGDPTSLTGEALDTSVVQDFSVTMRGRALLAFPQSSGVTLAQLLGQQDEGCDDLDFDLAGVLEEVGNIVLNAVLGSLANLFEGELDYTVPQLRAEEAAEGIIADYHTGSDEQTVLMADAHFDVANSAISGSLLLAFSMNEMAALLDKLVLASET
ncbi:MAG: chemotaxis protein CheC [Planctomycetota bacterium]